MCTSTAEKGRASSTGLQLYPAYSASIFDLSPAEKLQLVEDLWDDLAVKRRVRARYAPLIS
jgi:hypothetical protein